MKRLRLAAQLDLVDGGGRRFQWLLTPHVVTPWGVSMGPIARKWLQAVLGRRGSGRPESAEGSRTGGVVWLVADRSRFPAGVRYGNIGREPRLLEGGGVRVG